MPDGVNPCGPVFISYRWSDASGYAMDLARRLRASGVPVWLDRNDLPPGDTTTRLHEALESGLSGAVLVATEDLQPAKTGTDAILDIELPRLLELGEDPRFALAVLGTIPRADRPDRVDRDRTAVLYGRPESKGLTHYSSFDGSIDHIGADYAKERLRHLRAGRSDALAIDIQTRLATTAFASASDLVFRTVPPVKGRVPPREVWEDLQRFLAWLPSMIAAQRAPEVALLGGAHLAACFAFGAALPETSGTPLTVRATDGDAWARSSKGLRWWERLPHLGIKPSVRQTWRGEGSALAICVDLVPTTAPPTFAHYLDSHRTDFAAGAVVDLNRRLGPDDGPRVVNEVATIVRRLAASHDGAVHLFLRTPWAAATLMGSLLNTLQVTLYEWDNSIDPTNYVKTITVIAGVGGGPIAAVHIP